MAPERLVSDSRPTTRATYHHVAFQSWTETAGHTRLSNEAMARWVGIRKLWPDEPSAPGANAAAPTSIWEPSNKEAGPATTSNRSHHRRAAQYDDTPQHPSGLPTSLPPLCGAEQQSPLLDARPLNDASGLLELSRATTTTTTTTTSYSTSASRSWPSSSSGSDGGAECCTGLAMGHVTSPPPASARDDYNCNYNYRYRGGGGAEDDDDDDDDDDGRSLTRHLLSMAAADLRAKRASRCSVGGGSNGGGRPTDPTARKTFQFRCDAPVFTPMVGGSLGTF